MKTEKEVRDLLKKLQERKYRPMAEGTVESLLAEIRLLEWVLGEDKFSGLPLPNPDQYGGGP